MKAISLARLMYSPRQRVMTKSTHFWLPSVRSGLEIGSFAPGNTLSVREMRLFCNATTFFIYKSYCREDNFSCSLIASMYIPTDLSNCQNRIWRFSWRLPYRFYLADGTAALLDEQWIHHCDKNAVLMQRCRHQLMIPACGLITRVSSPEPRLANVICPRPASVWGYCLAFRTASFIGRRAIITLFPLAMSIPTAFISIFYVLDMGPVPVPRCSFNLLVDTNEPKR